MESRALASVVNLVDVAKWSAVSSWAHETSYFWRVPNTVQCQWYFQEDSKEQTSPVVGIAAPGYQLLHSTAEDRVKNDGSPYTWGYYTSKIGSIILARHVNATTIICINYPCDYNESIKDNERELRIQGLGPIPNVFMKPADMFPTACKFKTLFCSAGNKKRHQALFKAQLSEQYKSTSQELVYSVGEDCMSLSSGYI